MVRSILRSCVRLLAAIVLLALLVCAVEVLLRTQRLRSQLAGPSSNVVLEFTSPSQSTYIDVLPLQEISFATSAGETKVCRTNEIGTRGDSLVVPKPNGTYRILCLGSDDTFGIGVDQHHTFCHRLENYLQPMTTQKIEVVNAGCPKAGPLVNYLRLRQHLSALDPDVVLVNLNAEDLFHDMKVRGTVRLDENQKPAFAIHPKFKAKGSALVDKACAEFILAEWTVAHMGGLIGVNAPRSERSVVAGLEHQQGNFQPVFLIQQLIQTAYGHVIVSISPSPWSLQPSLPDGTGVSTSSLENDLRTALKQAQLTQVIPVHNSAELFQRSPDLKYLFSPHSGLLSAQGHDLYARSLANFFLQTIPDIWDTPPATSQLPPNSESNPFMNRTPVDPATMQLEVDQPQTGNGQLRPLPQADMFLKERL